MARFRSPDCQQVIALKSFGLSLGRIGELMSGRTTGLDNFLALHEAMLTQQRESADRALELVKAARTKLGEPVTSRRTISLI